MRWRRALDMNDRALRHVVVGLAKGNGPMRETRLRHHRGQRGHGHPLPGHLRKDLEARLGRIVVGTTPAGKPVRASDLGASAAMTALLLDALMPNLVQTREGTPAIVHGGPFANIAHGCNSILATRLALAYGQDVDHRGGLRLRPGGEKFLDIKCRAAGIWPRGVVLVATLRALKMHGGVPVARAAEAEHRRALQGARAPGEAPRDAALLRAARGGGHQRLPARHRRGTGGAARLRRPQRRGRRALRGLLAGAAKGRSSSPTR